MRLNWGVTKHLTTSVTYGLRRSGLARSEIQRRVEAGLEWAGLAPLAQHNARELSGGEKQRIALTRACMLSPRLLLLDEPTANMDIESREQTIHLIRRLKKEGISSIVTTHEPQLANNIGDDHLHLCKIAHVAIQWCDPSCISVILTPNRRSSVNSFHLRSPTGTRL